MRKRRKVKVANPNGYPYALYKIDSPKRVSTSIVVAVSPMSAIKQAGLKKREAKPELIDVNELVKKYGHSGTSRILKNIAPTWMTKQGKIFFKQAQ